MSSTVRKGLKVIEFLAHAKEPKGISEISREIDMNKSAVQRILNTLYAADYVEQASGTTKYQLTLSIWELGSHVVERHQARRLLHPILRFASQSTGYTVFLSYLSFPFIVYLDKVEGAHGRTHSAEPGSRVPITRTAAGKAVLAFLPEETLGGLGEELLDWSGYVRSECVALDSIKAELDLIRQRSYATSEGGLKQGVNSIAAPIWWREEQPYGSLVLTADEQNLPQEEFPMIGAKLVGMAEEATLALGGDALKRKTMSRFVTV